MNNAENTVAESVDTKSGKSDAPSIVWFRNDLRVADNPALMAATDRKGPVVCLYILETGGREIGGASKWWLNQSLTDLSKSIKKRGGTLILRKGDSLSILQQIVEKTSAGAVFWNRRYDKPGMQTDTDVKHHLKDGGLTVDSFKANLLFEPWEVKNKSGDYYKVYSPFKRACLSMGVDRGPYPAPEAISSYDEAVESESLSDWQLHPVDPDWSEPIAQTWTVGESGARERLEAFLHDGGIIGYHTDRNLPAKEGGTSCLSPHLAFGEISPYQIWAAANAPDLEVHSQDQETFLSEILWREFSYMLLYFNADLRKKNFQARFDAFVWSGKIDLLPSWQKGRTGYPMVDAGMRQLWHTGWMHNRVRMIVGSFLVKHLLLDWRNGEEWFWDTLVDADLANNAASWQWIAGSGADAAPYFRIFNPMTQGKKFDQEGAYIRKYVPELKDLPSKYLNAPWEAPDTVLKDAGIELGKTYPKPIVDHSVAREKALSAFAKTKQDA
ncbi:MAG: deoxyribodipyrimidine photo-lyase [Hyphomicrobiales bacterium]